jgi:hypothetical protein
MSELLLLGVAAAIAATYALILRHFNILPKKPTYKAERCYEGLTIGMERWAKDALGSPDTLTIYAHGDFKGRKVRDLALPFIPTCTENEMPMDKVVHSLNHYLTLDYNVTLPYDDPKLMKIIDELYDEMKIP